MFVTLVALSRFALSAQSASPPAPLPTNDLFYAYLTNVPVATSILSEEIANGILVRRFRFSSFEGSDDGSIRTNEIYAILARPAVSGSGKRPGMLICHGGYNAPEESKAVAWARLGFVAIAPEFPAYVAPAKLQSISRVAGRPYASQMLAASPDTLASTLFDSVVAGLGAFNYLASQPEVDANRICMTGISLGGYMVTTLCGLLDTRVLRAFSLWGTGFFAEDTHWTAELLAKPQREREVWIENFDAGTRIHRVRATYLLYAASNDSFFRPPSVMKTFDAIPGEKFLCVGPGDNHAFSLPGGTREANGEVWAGVEPAYFLHGVSNAASTLPKIKVANRQGRRVVLDVAGLPASAEVWGYYSANISAPWTARQWTRLNAEEDGGRFAFSLPATVTACDWVAGVSFPLSGGQVTRPASLSTVIYRESLTNYSQTQFEVSEGGLGQPRSFARVNEGGAVLLHRITPTNNAGIGGPRGWQWHFQGNAIPGATNTSLVISNASLANAGFYTLTASNDHATVSRSITVIVEPAVRTIYSKRKRTWPDAQVHHYLDTRAPHLAANNGSQLYLLGTDADMSGWFLTKFRQNGTPMWNRRFGPVATPAGLAVDAAQNVIVASTTNYWVKGGPVLTKYDPNGNVLWQKAVIAGKNPWRFTTDFAQNNAGELFLAGADAGAAPSGLFVVKVSADGARIWWRFLPVSPVWWSFTRASLAPTPGGGVYVASELGLIRFNLAGEQLWGRGSNFVAAAVAQDGNVYATGGQGTFKYSAAGELLWAAPLETGFVTSRDVKMDAFGVVVAHENGVSRFNPEGDRMWSAGPMLVGGLALDALGTAYYTSQSWNFVTRGVDLQGREVWQTVSDVTGSVVDEGVADMVVCPNGDIAVAHRNQDHYLLERYRIGASAAASPLTVAPNVSGMVAPGAAVCFSASGLVEQERFVWFRNGIEILGQTNGKLCVTADWDTEGAYSVAAISAQRVFTSGEAQFSLQRPYLYPPATVSNDQIQLRLLPFAHYGAYQIDASSDLRIWTAVTNLTGGGQPFSIILPQESAARFFRAMSR